MTTTINVPAPGRKWVNGALVRDGMTLYRVTGKPVRFHEDCLPTQRVAKVRDIPADWRAAARLVEIMEAVKARGMHTPDSRSATEGQPGEEVPHREGDAVRWSARQDARSYASYPRIEVWADVLCYVEPIYDDAPIVKWLVDQALADEARALIASDPSLTKYPRVSVRG